MIHYYEASFVELSLLPPREWFSSLFFVIPCTSFHSYSIPSHSINKLRTVSNTRPRWSRRRTIKAHLIVLVGLELSKLEILIGRRKTHLTATSGRNHAIFPEVSRLLVLILHRRLRHDRYDGYDDGYKVRLGCDCESMNMNVAVVDTIVNRTYSHYGTTTVCTVLFLCRQDESC